jgi:hypothetical protein
MRPSWAALLLSGCTVTAAPPPPEITIASLLAEMPDLTALERPARFHTRQASSWDRLSKSGDWFANKDFDEVLGVEAREGRTEYVLLDADGPGAVVRIWSAQPQGTLRVYLDGAAQPAIAEPMTALLAGSVAPFGPPLGALTAKGYSLYFPIPFARHCRITTDSREKLYYHVNTRQYPAGTRVRTFSRGEAEGLRAEIAAVAAQLVAPRLPSRGLMTRRVRLDVPAGGAARALLGDTGAGRIRELVLRPSRSDAAVLRRTWLVLRFDGRSTVQAPLGDFFGGGPGLRPFSSLPVTVDADGTRRVRWPMSYRESAALELRSLGGEAISVDAEVSWEAQPFAPGTYYFHARWHAPEAMAVPPGRDFNVVTLAGEGAFVGLALNVLNRTHGSWWGEGDEKIYFEEDKFPDYFGTGTEDYFGYAWCATERFSHPYHDQILVENGDWYGRTAVNRWHVLDVLRFERRMRFDLEALPWNPGPPLIYDWVAYWYAPAATDDNLPTVMPADVQIP